MNPQTRATPAAREAIFPDRIRAQNYGRSSTIGSGPVPDVRFEFVVVSSQVAIAPRASSFDRHGTPWVEQLYALATNGQHGEAIDLVYDHVEPMLVEDLERVDNLLMMLNPAQLSAEEIVAVLIVTLGARDRLVNRPDFIARSRGILAREEEGADGVLHGLV